jgi:hypothetical protein
MMEEVDDEGLGWGANIYCHASLSWHPWKNDSEEINFADSSLDRAIRHCFPQSV